MALTKKLTALLATRAELDANLSNQLRKSILQEAIQGKLVEQNPDNEPASVLLERIKQEKERLIKEKKIKRDKQDSIIYRGDDNKYYEQTNGQLIEVDCDTHFPQSWQLCRLSFICQLIDGQKRKENKSALTQSICEVSPQGQLLSMANSFLKATTSYLSMAKTQARFSPFQLMAIWAVPLSNSG